ncbi:MAG: AI-2E family transporter [Clostridia bacterium]|nr:AI-2E family transporter [Clostridia bacterium]
MKHLIPEEYRKVSRAAMAVIAFAALLAAVLIYLDRITAFLSSLMSTLTPFFFGGALAFIQMPIDRRLSSLLRKTLFRKKPNSKGVRIISTVASLLLIIAFLVLFCYILLPQVADSGATLVNQVTRFVDENDDAINQYLKRLGLVSEDVDPLNSTWQNLLSYATNYASLLPTVLRTSYNMVYTAIFTLFIGLIVSFYLLWDRERLARQGKKLCYALMKKDTCELFIYWVRRASRTFAGFTTGKIIDSLIVGVLCYVFMLIAGLEYSALISVIIGVTNILPFFGPFIGAVPSILILLIVNPSSALKFAIFILILQQVDGNIIGPKILGDYTGISSLLTMVAIIVGSALFGFVGMLLSVPVCAVLYAMFKTMMNRRLVEKGLPESSDAYGEDPPVPMPLQAAADEKQAQTASRSRRTRS